MSDEIKKQIAGLIGHHQLLEKRVMALTEDFQAAAMQLQRQSETLSHVIGELDSASGNMTETVRQSVSAALIQVEKELLWGMYYFIDSGYARIAEMQRMEAVWQKKAPLADISRCDGKPCVKVDTRTTYGDKENTWMILKK